MKIQSLGHVVLKVRDRKRSEAFYAGVLGLPLVARFEGPLMSFFSLGDHHDFAVMEVGPDAPLPAENGVGVHHVAFKIGNSLDDLKKAKAYLEGAGIPVKPVDHEVTQSLYMQDPDGNGIEVYVDVSDVWRAEPQRVAQGRPLAI